MMKFTPEFVDHMADLAKLTITPDQAQKLAGEFEESMEVVDQLTQVEVGAVAPTYQVNDLVNVTRVDVADRKRLLTQEQALANAPRTHQGYIVVERVIDHEA